MMKRILCLALALAALALPAAAGQAEDIETIVTIVAAPPQTEIEPENCANAAPLSSRENEATGFAASANSVTVPAVRNVVVAAWS